MDNFNLPHKNQPIQGESGSENFEILIAGGTTEGRTAVQVCDEAAKTYVYSTRNASQQVECVHGKRFSGELNEESMPDFCRQNHVRLIIDAAHPFALNVHRNIGYTAQKLHLSVIRFERSFPPYNPLLHWFDDYASAIRFLEEKNIRNLLALTGVNTIAQLKPYWEKHPCIFRIMNRQESLLTAEKSNFPRENILYYEDERDDNALFQRLRPQAIITKESGESGGFTEKIETALALNIPVLVIRRPSLPYTPSAIVYGKHGLRKQIEMLLPDFFEQKTGYTTGVCACAAAKASLISLITQQVLHSTAISLPNGEPITIAIANTEKLRHIGFRCSVNKDAGDDPDVTNGIEICSLVIPTGEHFGIRFLQGEGVGRVTLPGLGLEIGAPAINPTPRQMIERELNETYEQLTGETLKTAGVGFDVIISVPRGEEIAKRTFNPKLGIEGGISIIGTSGIVKPYSSEAFVNSIRREAQVAKALGVKRLIINSGAKSEKFLKALYPDASPQAFIQYGNFIGETLKIAAEEQFEQVTLGIMLGKAVKLAEGLLDTHSKKSVMNKTFIQSIAQEAGCTPNTIEKIGLVTLARELWSIIPKEEARFFQLLRNRCHKVCEPLFPNGELIIWLMDEDGKNL